jgi:PBSX family phage terminase large subunit
MKLKIGNSTILFRGCANKNEFQRIKSIKFKKGFCKYSVFEETTEFSGMEEIRQINASLFRGSDIAKAFYMYNPPASKKNWCNKEFESLNQPSNRLIHHSTYLSAPKKWLGKVFLEEAKILKKVNPRKYDCMYMGNVLGEGLEIYPNVQFKTITDKEIENFDKIYRGFDFGFTKDASCYIEIYYDKENDCIYLIDEVYGHRLSNQKLYDLTYPLSGYSMIWADAAEPRTISELKGKGLNIMKAKKGKDSKDHGIKWLSDLAKIVIDKKRTPFAAADFELYEYEKDKDDNVILEYPKEPHASAATRYALHQIILQKKITFGGRRK